MSHHHDWQKDSELLSDQRRHQAAASVPADTSALVRAISISTIFTSPLGPAEVESAQICFMWLPCWPLRAAGTTNLSQLSDKLFTFNQRWLIGC